MKKLLSLTLILIMLLGMLSSCNNAQESTDSATRSNTSTDTSTDTSADIQQNPLKITINTLEPTSKNSISLLNRYDLGAYLGNEIPSAKNNTSFSDGEYYKLIKSYEELSLLVENTSPLPQNAFEEHYVLAIGVFYSSAPSYLTYAYGDLRYEPHASQLRITEYVEYSKKILETLPEAFYYNTYLLVNKNSFYLREYFEKIDTGTLISIKENIKFYSAPETVLLNSSGINELEIGSTFIFDFYKHDDGRDMFEKYGVELADESWPYNCETDFVYIAIYARHCKHHIGYDDIHITDGAIYVTLKTLEHDQECTKLEPTIKLIAISESKLLQKELNESTEIKILVEETKIYN